MFLFLRKAIKMFWKVGLGMVDLKFSSELTFHIVKLLAMSQRDFSNL